jgi:hypothetical protein
VPVIRDGNEIVLNHLARCSLPHAISQAIWPSVPSVPDASEMRGLKSVGDLGGEAWPVRIGSESCDGPWLV